MRTHRRWTLGCLALLTSGCAMGRAPVTGFLYSDVWGPDGATDGVAGNRVGQACATSILGIVATGDASIEAARRAGQIQQISAVDYHTTSYVGVYAKSCTVVRGR